MKMEEFFYLHKSDRQILLGLLLSAVLVLLILFYAATDAELNDNSAQVATQDTLNKSTPPSGAPAYYAAPARTVERFAFDPNTADSTALLRLGLQPWQVRSIYKYRAAGGVYSRKEDFARLYGLTVKQYRELEPYISIGSDYLPASTLLASRPQREDSLVSRAKMAEGETIDLATADTALLQRVPGIGPYFARRIVDYRRRLGGYVSVAQLDEIDDFPASAVPFFTLGAPVVERLNLNRLSLNELKRHPYLSYYQARTIVDYRRRHGPLASLDDLSLLDAFPQDALERLSPYVEF